MLSFAIPFWWLLIASFAGFYLGFMLMALLVMSGKRRDRVLRSAKRRCDPAGVGTRAVVGAH